jgi:SAM-dependent methyltransferase
MHTEAYEWVRRHATSRPVAVLDLGGRDINGTPRRLFPNATVYRVVDMYDGPGVDIVTDAATWTPDQEYDVVVCCETFEHTPDWAKIVATAYQACRPGGKLILTMAGPGRPEHSAIDGGWTLHPGEHYGNVEPGDLYNVLVDCGWTNVHVDYQPSPADTRAVATKPASIVEHSAAHDTTRADRIPGSSEEGLGRVGGGRAEASVPAVDAFITPAAGISLDRALRLADFVSRGG